MKPIGGYLELGLPAINHAHAGALCLNSGRNALEYILQSRGYKRIYVPRYTCPVLYQPLIRTSIQVHHYDLNDFLEPQIDVERLLKTDAFLYTNYFGLKDVFIKALAGRVRHLIIDNAQALFAEPLPGIDTFYSPRKFFGLPDGGLLYTTGILQRELALDNSTDRIMHLIKRKEHGPEAGYSDFLENEKKLDTLGLMRISELTRSLWHSVDYTGARQIRLKNFNALHRRLQDNNRMTADLLTTSGTFCYPYLIENGEQVKRELINRKIFVPTFWPGVEHYLTRNSIEMMYLKDLVCLPIDQRYSEAEMEYIADCIQELGGK